MPELKHLSHKESECEKSNQANETGTSSHGSQTTIPLKFGATSRNLSYGKKSCILGVSHEVRKDRKLSENTHDALLTYLDLRNNHQNE